MNKHSHIGRAVAREGLKTTRSRREREKEEHRRLILGAAEAVFAEKGFERATMEEVAQRAEFSVGALYVFFKNKEALFGEVIRGIAQGFYETFRQTVRTGATPMGCIRAIVRLHLQEIVKHGAFFRAVIAEKPGSLLCPDSAIPTECRAIYDAYIDDLARVFRKAMARREIRKTDPRYAALALEGVMHAYTAFWHRRGMEVPLERQIDIVYRNYVDGLLLERDKKS